MYICKIICVNNNMANTILSLRLNNRALFVVEAFEYPSLNKVPSYFPNITVIDPASGKSHYC